MVEPDDDQARGGTGWALPQPLHAANEGLAFLLELVMLAGLAWWGWQAVGGIAGRVALAILTPGLAAVVWGLLAAPRARIRLPLPGVLAVKAVAFGGASVAVYSMGHHALAIAFAAVAAVNTALAAMDRNALMTTRAGLRGASYRGRAGARCNRVATGRRTQEQPDHDQIAESA
jgi:hypothetical protein